MDVYYTHGHNHPATQFLGLYSFCGFYGFSYTLYHVLLAWLLIFLKGKKLYIRWQTLCFSAHCVDRQLIAYTCQDTHYVFTLLVGYIILNNAYYFIITFSAGTYFLCFSRIEAKLRI